LGTSKQTSRVEQRFPCYLYSSLLSFLAVPCSPPQRNESWAALQGKAAKQRELSCSKERSNTSVQPGTQREVKDNGDEPAGREKQFQVPHVLQRGTLNTALLWFFFFHSFINCALICALLKIRKQNLRCFHWRLVQLLLNRRNLLSNLESSWK